MKLLVVFILLLIPAQAEAEGWKQASPGQPWRVIYVEGGPYRDYRLSLIGLAKGLAQKGLIESAEMPELISEKEGPGPKWSNVPLQSGMTVGGDKRLFPDDHLRPYRFSAEHCPIRGAERGLPETDFHRHQSANQARAEEDSWPVWNYLAERAGGDRLHFLADGFYSAGWDERRRREIKAEVRERLARGEVDLILALGTDAGEDFVTGDHQTVVLSITATDPVAAGFCRSEQDSGFDHVHVQVETGRIERQLSMFKEIIGFTRLGLPLDSGDKGDKSMGLAAVEAAAARLGLEIVTCRAELELPDLDQAADNLIACLDVLSEYSEAVYLPVNNGMIEERIGEIVAALIEARVPTFSQKGPAETRRGVLLSLAEDDFLAAGLWEAEVIEKVLAGARPRDISQIYQPPLTMAVNLRTARAIGWRPDFELLATMDAIYGLEPSR